MQLTVFNCNYAYMNYFIQIYQNVKPLAINIFVLKLIRPIRMNGWIMIDVIIMILPQAKLFYVAF